MKIPSGKALLRKRGHHIEPSFAHVLDQGGLRKAAEGHGRPRKATLRGEFKLTKRHLSGALASHLSLLMRHLTGHGTPKRRLAAPVPPWQAF